MQGTGDRVLLTQRRTGREYGFRVSVRGAGAADLAIDVTSRDDLGGAQLGLSDLPERPRLAIVAALRSQLVERCFTTAERTELATGAADLAHVAARALLRAVSALEHDQSPQVVAAVTDLADLFDLQGLPIPFDVQSEFERIRAQAPAGLAWRLGFAEAD
jgi:hypothetical protein